VGARVGEVVGSTTSGVVETGVIVEEGVVVTLGEHPEDTRTIKITAKKNPRFMEPPERMI
jgi:hypothetical protein